MKRIFSISLSFLALCSLALLSGCPKKQLKEGEIIWIMGLKKAPKGTIKQLKPSKYRLDKEWFKKYLKGQQRTAALRFQNKGYRLIQIAAGSFWNRSGLQNGDIVVSVNGKDPREIKKELERMKSPTVIKVQRGKHTFRFRYVFE